LEVKGNVTVDTTGTYLAGVFAELNTGAGVSITQTGTYLAAFAAAVTDQKADKWGSVLFAKGEAADMGVYIGEHADTAGSGINLGNVTAGNRFHTDDGGSALTGNRRGVLSRLAVIAEHSGALSLASICGQTKLVGNVDFDGDYLCGLYGYLEMGGTNDLDLNSTRHAACAIRARTEVGGSLTIGTAGSYLAGVFAELNTTGAWTITQTGVLAAFVAAATDQRNDLWGSALYIDGADNALGFAAADTGYTNGIKAVTQTPTGNTSHVIRVDIGGTPGYIPVYAAEALGN
jgi:hypothetical protein